MKKYKLLIISILCAFSVIGQEAEKDFFEQHPFVNMTDFGVILGRIKTSNYCCVYYATSSSIPQDESFTIKSVANLTLRTFNGIYLQPKTAVGITTGVDWYNGVLLMPVAGGIRQTLVQKKNGGSSIYAGLDAGYGAAWLQIDDSYHTTKGGLMFNPTVGFRLPMRNHSAWLLNFGYNFQHLSIKQTNEYDPYYLSVETRNHQRISVRMGIEF